MKTIVQLVVMGSILIGIASCASGRGIVRINCPNHPIMLSVAVRRGSISGPDLSHAIENHQSLWQYIRVIEKLGCTNK